MINRAYWRAIYSLGHPLTVFAVILLLINDHWLRYETPSWLTGKLGDFAWLIFAPMVCALVVAWLIPKSHPSHEKLVGLVSFGLIGVWFATAKTIAPVHGATTRILDAIVGWQGGLGMDVTDLIALPALVVGWRIWHSARITPSGRFSAHWVILGLALMGTMATSCVFPDRGIVRACLVGDSVYMGTDFSFFRTNDGETRQSTDFDGQLRDCSVNLPETTQLRDEWELDAGTRHFRFVMGEGIYVSEDGQAERMEINFTDRQHDAYKRYYEEGGALNICPGSTYIVGPIDAVFDARNDELYVAMGLEGVLKRSAAGEWSWIRVGDYHHTTLDDFQSIIETLKPEFWVAVGLLILVPPTVGMSASAWSCLRFLGLGFVWGGWALFRTAAVAYYFPPVLFVGLCAILVAVILNIRLADYYIFQRKLYFAYFTIIALAVGTAALFFLPYVFWIRRTILNYGTAAGFATLLCLTCIISGNQFIQWRYPPEKKKKTDDYAEFQKWKHDEDLSE